MAVHMRNGIQYGGIPNGTVKGVNPSTVPTTVKQLNQIGAVGNIAPVTIPSAVKFSNGDTLETAIGSVATIETSPAVAAHDAGEYIFYNGQMYKVIAAIAVGETLTVDTNIEATSVGTELTQLNNGLTNLMPWKTAGQVTGKTSISLPSEFNEIFIISYAPTHYIYLQFLPRGALVSSERLIGNGFQSSYYGTWYVSETAVRLGSYRDNGNDYSSSCSTTVYYR